jgi:hypothetical protein
MREGSRGSAAGGRPSDGRVEGAISGVEEEETPAMPPLRRGVELASAMRAAERRIRDARHWVGRI